MSCTYMTKNKKYMRYKSYLKENIPAPGNAYHPKLFGVADYGLDIGRSPKHLLKNIRNNLKLEKRLVSNQEIIDAIKKVDRDKERLSNFRSTGITVNTYTEDKNYIKKLLNNYKLKN